jgi:hypothetical protein
MVGRTGLQVQMCFSSVILLADFVCETVVSCMAVEAEKSLHQSRFAASCWDHGGKNR